MKLGSSCILRNFAVWHDQGLNKYFSSTDIVNQLLNKNAWSFGIEMTVRNHTNVENYMLAFKNKVGL